MAGGRASHLLWKYACGPPKRGNASSLALPSRRYRYCALLSVVSNKHDFQLPLDGDFARTVGGTQGRNRRSLPGPYVHGNQKPSASSARFLPKASQTAAYCLPIALNVGNGEISVFLLTLERSRDQFGTQVQKRWKLTKNVKRKDQHDAFVQAQERGETPTEALIGHRLIPWKKIRKTALAMSNAQRKGEASLEYISTRQRQHAQGESERISHPVPSLESIPTENQFSGTVRFQQRMNNELMERIQNRYIPIATLSPQNRL